MRLIPLLLAVACAPAMAVTYPCQPPAGPLPAVHPELIVGDKRGPLTVSTADGSGAFWYCKDAKSGAVTYWQYHATISAQQGGMANWYMHIANWGQTVVNEARTADCAQPTTLADDSERRLCAAIVSAVQKSWPK